MDAILIFLTSLASAYLARRLAQREPFGLPDLVIGLFAGFMSLVLARFLDSQNAGASLGLPLLLACCLALGLESLQQPATAE